MNSNILMMKKLTNKQKNISVGYYWWIFRINSFINFVKPYMNAEYADKYSSPNYYHVYNSYNKNKSNLDYHYSNYNQHYNQEYNHHYGNHFFN